MVDGEGGKSDRCLNGVVGWESLRSLPKTSENGGG